MLRRYEMYSIRPDAPAAEVERFADSFLRCGSIIPEVLDSAIGTNLSDVPLQLVWEHAYASPEAYQRYMVHPYHACILDRALLADSPERIVSSNDVGAGLVGYVCDTPVYRMTAGIRRLVLLDLSPGEAAAFSKAGERDIGGLRVSVVAENSMASAWFDGVTPITAPPRWSHVWEQGWDSLAAFEAYRASSLAGVEPEGRSASVHYEPRR